MAKLLSICIPTYNRAEKLNHQLIWLSKAIQGFEDDCEIIISDNFSTDKTADITQAWQTNLSERVPVKINRNSENIGLMPNIGYCIETATAQFVWVIGDDDPISETAIAFVVNTLKKHPELTLLLLNFSSKDYKTGEIINTDWLDRDLEASNADGKEVFRRCIDKDIGSVIFLSANIYRTDLVQAALQQWPECLDNWAGLAYWSGYCASRGSVMVTKDDYMYCIVGNSSWQKDPKIWLKIRYKDIPEIFKELQKIGYSRKYCRKKILESLWPIFTGGYRCTPRRDIVRGLFRWPLWMTALLGKFLILAGVSLIQIVIPEAPSPRLLKPSPAAIKMLDPREV